MKLMLTKISENKTLEWNNFDRDWLWRTASSTNLGNSPRFIFIDKSPQNISWILWVKYFKKEKKYIELKQLVYYRATWHTFHPSLKNKKNPPHKKFLTFQKMELSSSNIKKFLYFLKRKFFSYFQNWNPALFSPSSKNKKNPPQENSLYFREWKPPKNYLHFIKKSCLYISGKGNPEKIPKPQNQNILHFSKRIWTNFSKNSLG